MRIRPFVALFAVVGACQSPTAPPLPTEAPIAGVYELATVNGSPCPCVVMVIPPEVFRWRRGVLTLNDDSTFVDSLFGEVDASPLGGVTKDSSAVVGTYSLAGNLLILQPDDRPTYVMARDGAELTRFIPRRHLSAVLLDLTLVYRH